MSCFSNILFKLYTALSRVRTPKNIKIMIEDSTEQGKFNGIEGTWTKNIVYPEIFEFKF